MSESEAQRRRRWINLGELIAIAALIVSALGVWIAWQSSQNDKPTRVVEQRQPIPLVLRGTVERDGRELTIRPVEDSHALESLTLTIKGSPPVDGSSSGTIDADDLEAALKGDDKKGTHSVAVRLDARYVEMGKDNRGGGNYMLRYRWEGGGLLGGRSLRLVGLSKG